MAKLLTDNGELVVQVERNKTRIKVGIEEPSAWTVRDTGGYAERWLSMDELTWFIDELVRARRGIRDYNICKSIREFRRSRKTQAIRDKIGPRTQGTWRSSREVQKEHEEKYRNWKE